MIMIREGLKRCNFNSAEVRRFFRDEQFVLAFEKRNVTLTFFKKVRVIFQRHRVHHEKNDELRQV